MWIADAMLGQAGRQRGGEAGRDRQRQTRGMQMCSSSSRLVHGLEADHRRWRARSVSEDQGQDKGKGLQTT
jgi:hypothetical protein